MLIALNSSYVGDIFQMCISGINFSHEAGHLRIDALKRWCWRRLLRVPWTAKRSNQSILKEINPEYSLDGLMLSSFQSLSHVRLFAIPWIAACQASLSITNSWSSPRLMSIELVMPSNHLILSHPLLLLPSIFPQHQGLFKWVTSSQQVAKVFSFNFSISHSNENSGLISFRADWVDLLEVQETLKSLLQHNNSKASILWHSAFFMIQLSHPYTTTGKTIAFTIWTCVGKVMSLLFNDKVSRS